MCNVLLFSREKFQAHITNYGVRIIIVISRVKKFLRVSTREVSKNQIIVFAQLKHFEEINFYYNDLDII